jgi:GNAT superfamily N-acetyltransferase
VLVRQRRDDDLPRCVRALEAVHAADGYPMRWPTDPAAWLCPTELASAWVADDADIIAGHVGVVVGVDDPVLATLTGVPVQRLASVTRLFVAPEARGRRLGAALMGRAHSYAVDRGLQLVLDVVDDGGPAVALYDRLGWRMVDRRRADWTTPGRHRPPIRLYVAPDRPSAPPPP